MVGPTHPIRMSVFGPPHGYPGVTFPTVAPERFTVEPQPIFIEVLGWIMSVAERLDFVRLFVREFFMSKFLDFCRETGRCSGCLLGEEPWACSLEIALIWSWPPCTGSGPMVGAPCHQVEVLVDNLSGQGCLFLLLRLDRERASVAGFDPPRRAPRRLPLPLRRLRAHRICGSGRVGDESGGGRGGKGGGEASAAAVALRSGGGDVLRRE